MCSETDVISAERIAAAYDHIAADYAVINAAMPPHLAELATRFLILRVLRGRDYLRPGQLGYAYHGKG